MRIRTVLLRDCLQCNKSFQKPIFCGILEWNRKRRFCSRICASRYNIGRPLPLGASEKRVHKILNNGKKRIGWDYYKGKALERDNWTCKCGWNEPMIMEVDHIIPLSKGGMNQLSNLQTLCPNCHRRKTLLNKENIHMADEPKVVTQDMLDENPALKDAGVQVGDPIVAGPAPEVPVNVPVDSTDPVDPVATPAPSEVPVE